MLLLSEGGSGPTYTAEALPYPFSHDAGKKTTVCLSPFWHVVAAALTSRGHASRGQSFNPTKSFESLLSLFNTAAKSPILFQVYSQLAKLATDRRASANLQHVGHLALGQSRVTAQKTCRHPAQGGFPAALLELVNIEIVICDIARPDRPGGSEIVHGPRRPRTEGSHPSSNPPTSGSPHDRSPPDTPPSNAVLWANHGIFVFVTLISFILRADPDAPTISFSILAV